MQQNLPFIHVSHSCSAPEVGYKHFCVFVGEEVLYSVSLRFYVQCIKGFQPREDMEDIADLFARFCKIACVKISGLQLFLQLSVSVCEDTDPGGGIVLVVLVQKMYTVIACRIGFAADPHTAITIICAEKQSCIHNSTSSYIILK